MQKVDILNLTSIPPVEIIHIDGQPISYRKLGNGTPIFCLPPWPSGSLVFYPFSKAVEDEFEVISIDLPGWGGHSKSIQKEYRLDDYLRIIESFISYFNVKQYHVLGYSFGGLFTQLLLSQNRIHPQKVVYVSTIHSGNELKSLLGGLIKTYGHIKNIPLTNPLIKRVIKSIFIYDHEHNKQGVYPHVTESVFFKELVNEGVLGTYPEDILEIWNDIFELDALSDELKKTSSHVIFAENDNSIIKSESYDLAHFLNVVPTVIPLLDHGHFTFGVNDSVAAIVDFLKK